jgi:hypothetical protein
MAAASAACAQGALAADAVVAGVLRVCREGGKEVEGIERLGSVEGLVHTCNAEK